MNASVAVFLTILVVVSAGNGYYNNHNWDRLRTGFEGKDGFTRSNNGIQALFNNAARQRIVNNFAEKLGFSSGTAKYYGVPGTGLIFDGEADHGKGR